MGKMTKEKIGKVAHSIRVALSDEEADKFTQEVNDMIERVERLQELNTDAVEPTTHGIVLENVMREDEPKQSITQEETLENAPDKQDGHFKVPSIME